MAAEETGDDLPRDLQLVYEELVRLEGRIDTMTESSFEDFKLLGALGAVLGLSPVAEYFKADVIQVSGEVKLLMFLTLFAILAVVSFRDLMKQSLIRFLMSEANVCAEILADKLDERARPAFSSAGRWEKWATQRHAVVARNFSLVVLVPATVLPAVVLRDDGALCAVYVVVTLVTYALYGFTANRAVAALEAASPSALPRS